MAVVSDSHYQSTLDTVYVIVPRSELPIAPSYPHHPRTPGRVPADCEEGGGDVFGGAEGAMREEREDDGDQVHEVAVRERGAGDVLGGGVFL